MVLLNFKVSKPLYELVEKSAEKLKVSKSELLRRALLGYLVDEGLSITDLAKLNLYSSVISMWETYRSQRILFAALRALMVAHMSKAEPEVRGMLDNLYQLLSGESARSESLQKEVEEVFDRIKSSPSSVPELVDVLKQLEVKLIGVVELEKAEAK